ncbi:MAG TPA: hypothetical protein VJY41_02340 [Prolixibacteraceae bacterium]|nr:hypothetical protein [Prolixibacteraceae bacterium]
MSNFLFFLNNKKRVNTKVLVVIFFLMVLTTLSGYGQCAIGPANCKTYQETRSQFTAANTKTVGVDVTVNGNFTFSPNQMLLIPSGVTYTGNITGNNHTNVMICIAQGGILGDVTMNNFTGIIRNYNTNNTLTFSNFKCLLENYGGTININSGEGRNLLNCSGTINWKSNLNLNGYSIYNNGTIVIDNELQGGSGCIVNMNKLTIGNKNTTNDQNAYSATIQLENYGQVTIKGKMQGSGSVLNEAWMTIGTYVGNNNFTNNGKIEIVGTSLHFNGGTVINNCAFFSSADGAKFQNNTNISNNGLIYLPIGNFETKSAGIITNGPKGVLRTRDFTNEGLFTGSGWVYVSRTSHNKNNGVFGQGADTIHFYDASPGGNPSAFDTIYGASSIGGSVKFTPFPEPLYSPDLSNYACGDVIMAGSVNPGEIASSQVLCIGVNPVTFTSVTPATCPDAGITISYQWQISTDNLFYTNISGRTNANFGTAPTRPTQTTYYRRRAMAVYPAADSIKNSTGHSNVVTLTPVNKQPASITFNPSDVTGCLGSNAQFTAGASNYDSRRWQLSTNGGTSWADLTDATPYSGTTTDTLNITGVTAGMTTYRYRMAAINNDCGTVYSNSATLTVNARPKSVVSGTATICRGGSTTISVALTGTQPWALTWSNGTTSTSVTGITTSPYTFSVNPIANTTYTVTALSDAKCTSVAGDRTGSAVVTVNQPSVAPTGITGTSTICRGSSTTLTATGGTLGSGARYQWGTGSTVGSNPILGATSVSYSPSPTITTTYWVRIENTTSPCTANTGGVTQTVTVNQPSVAPTGITGTNTICRGSSTTLTATGGTLGSGARYQWGTGSTVGSNPILGATSVSYSPSPTATTTYWVRIENTTSPCTANTGGVTQIVTVNQPSVAPTGITGTSNICRGSSTTLTATGGTLGTGARYQWGTGSTVGTNPISGATSNSYSPSPTSTTTYWVRIENTTSPCTANTGGVTQTVTVNQPSVAPTGITGTSTICNGSSTTLTATGGALGTGARYQWGTGSTVGTNPISGATSNSYSPSPTATTTYWVRIENTTSPCTATTGGVTQTVTVNQPSVAPTGITGTSTICNGSSTTLTATGGTLGSGARYQWGTGSTVGSNPISGATSVSYSASPTITTTYWVRIENTTSPCTATTVGVSQSVTVSAQPTAPTLDAKTPNLTNICTGQGVSATFTAGSGGVGCSDDYVLIIDGGTPVAYTSGSTVGSSATSSIVIQGRRANCTSGSGCTGTNYVELARWTVNARPTSVVSGSSTVCNGGSATISVALTGAQPWALTWSDGSTPTSVTGITTSPYTFSVSPTANTTYTVTALNDVNCTSVASDFTGSATVTVNARPTSVVSGSATLCNGGSTTISVALTGAQPWSLTWSDGSTPTSVTGITTSPYTFSVNPTANTTYTVTALSDVKCTSVAGDRTGSAVVTVNARPTSVVSGSATVCNGGGATISVALTGTQPWSLTWSDGSTPTSVTGITTSPYTFSVSPTVNTTYTVTALNDVNCTSVASDLTGSALVTVNARPTSVVSGSATVCNGGSTTISVALTGTQPWALTWSDGSTPTSVTGITTSPYTFSVSPTANTTYTVTALSDANCTSVAGDRTGSALVTVNSLPTVSIADNSICVGGTTTLSPTTGGTWLSDSPSVASVTNDGVVTGLINGSTTFTFTETASTCSNSTASLTVNPLPQGGLSPNGPLCFNGDGELTWTATAGTGPFTVVYNDGNSDHTVSNVVSGTAFELTPKALSETTLYTLVSVTDTHGCKRSSGFTTNKATIIVRPQPQVSASLVSANPICPEFNNLISYPNGTTFVEFKVNALAHTGNWSFDFTIDDYVDIPYVVVDTILSGDATQPTVDNTSSSRINCYNNTTVNIRFEIKNIPEQAFGVYFKIEGLNDGIYGGGMLCSPVVTDIVLSTLIKAMPAAPTGRSLQTVCSLNTPTVADLVVVGSLIQWYDASSGGILLTSNTELVDGKHYYASQIVDGCESVARLDVHYTVLDNIQAIVTRLSDDYACPELIPAQGFESDNSGPYDVGATKVIFRVERQNSLANTWGFDFNVSGTSVKVEDVSPAPSSGNDDNGTYTGLTGDYVDLEFLIKNIEKTPLTVTLNVTSITDSNGCSDATERSKSSHILSMPHAGPFKYN